ncbi:hypothetical protein [uncultured Desulfovibrio sp.]|uniref:hypothetical protein n=1 Tax=uncultured Desulfovibrio sp. TaxID=167968 RepID=UPI002672D1DC|nr:hypothetical protein [uncultured Desulfovibrio sp.]
MLIPASCRRLGLLPYIFCCLFLGLGLFSMLSPSPARAANTADPRQCLVEVGQAIDAADAAVFERLVDVDAILGAALTLFLRDVQKPEVADQLPPLLAVMFSQAASGDAGGNKLRDLLFSEARAFVINGVSSGAFAGRAPSGGSAQGMLAPLFADASTGRKEIRRIGQARPDGHGWLVPFVVHDAGNAESYPVLGRLSPVENGFRLTSVENLEELLGRVRAESLNLSQ